MKKFFAGLAMIIILTIVGLFAHSGQAKEGSLGERTAKECQNGGLANCDWCMWKEFFPCPNEHRHEHAEGWSERTQPKKENGNNSELAIVPILLLGGAVAFAAVIFLNRGRVTLA